MGSMVELVPGSGTNDRAVLLPSQEKADDRDLARSLHVGILMPWFEQFHGLNGYYGQNFSENSVTERQYISPGRPHQPRPRRAQVAVHLRVCGRWDVGRRRLLLLVGCVG
jgi:hypothetical protein